jgi:hypothetical protein
MEAICSSEMSVDTQRTARRYIPEDGTLQHEVSSTCCLLHAGSTLNMGPIFSSEISRDFNLSTPRYIPEDETLYSHRCENIKSKMWPEFLFSYWRASYCIGAYSQIVQFSVNFGNPPHSEYRYGLRYLSSCGYHLDVVRGPSTPHDPDSYAGGSLSSWQGHPSR